MNGFYAPPGDQISPGDIFQGIPLPLLRFPLSFFRPCPDMRQNDREFAESLTPDQVRPREGEDSPKSGLLVRTVMLVSHGCEVDNLLLKHSLERRHWLVAPIESFEGRSDDLQRRIRDRAQPNKFYLPPGEYLGPSENFVDFRRITPINIPYLMLDGRKLCSLTDDAQLELQGHLGLFFTGLVFYVQPVSCPVCEAKIDPTQFLIPSGEEDDQD